jgi:hypothetical protein
MGVKATAASDIYSFAICMFEMFLLQPPFTDAELMIGRDAFKVGILSGALRPRIPGASIVPSPFARARVLRM